MHRLCRGHVLHRAGRIRLHRLRCGHGHIRYWRNDGHQLQRVSVRHICKRVGCVCVHIVRRWRLLYRARGTYQRRLRAMPGGRILDSSGRAYQRCVHGVPGGRVFHGVRCRQQRHMHGMPGGRILDCTRSSCVRRVPGGRVFYGVGCVYQRSV